MREAFPYPAAIELDPELDEEWPLWDEFLVWADWMVTILGATSFVVACCFLWGYYS
jgi:hypothetical protein